MLTCNTAWGRRRDLLLKEYRMIFIIPTIWPVLSLGVILQFCKKSAPLKKKASFPVQNPLIYGEAKFPPFKYTFNMQNSSLFLLSHILAKWIIEWWTVGVGECCSAANLQSCHTDTLPNCSGAIPRRQKAWLICPIKPRKSIILVDGRFASLHLLEFHLSLLFLPNRPLSLPWHLFLIPHHQTWACVLLEFCWTYVLAWLCNASWFRDAWLLCRSGKCCLAFLELQNILRYGCACLHD